MKKIISLLVTIILVSQILTVTSFAEDVNEFPPQRPSAGVMKVKTDSSGEIVMGLRTNGTINIKAPEPTFFGIGFSKEIKEQLMSLTNIADIACTGYVAFALRHDGTVYMSDSVFDKTQEKYKDVRSWTDIVSIEAGYGHIAVLKSDGTVVTAGDNDKGQCDVMGWNNVSKICAINNATIAIKKDGSLLATGAVNNYSEIRKYKNVKEIIYTGGDSFEVLLNDGTTSLTNSVFNKTTFSNEDMPVNEHFKKMGNNDKIKNLSGSHYPLILTESGDLYNLKFDNSLSAWTTEKLEENIVWVYFPGKHQDKYYALDGNGQIWSNNGAFTSDDWILTTNITYNGKKVNSDVPPYVKDGRTLAPIRAILEALGMNVSWDEATKTAIAVKADISISVSINSNIAIVNGIQKALDVPAEITNGRTFVPVRFFAEALNMNVDWDAYTKTVIIESK